jgi:hypothetical protein
MATGSDGRCLRGRDLRWLCAVVIAVGVAACGASTGGHQLVAGVVVGSSGSCKALTPGQQFALARVVLRGTMLAGPAVASGGRQVLLSPARVRVSQYLKGRGPAVIKVQTAITRSSGGYNEDEDGIEPVAGQHWLIFSTERRQPIATSICAGSRRQGTPPLGFKRFEDDGLSFYYAAGWNALRGRRSFTFTTPIVFLSPQRLGRECAGHRNRHRQLLLTCGLPVKHLRATSLVASWSVNAEPGWRYSTVTGTPIHVDGLPAKLSTTHHSCGVGADQRLDVVIQDPRRTDSWYQLTACSRGPSIAFQNLQVRELLQTTKIAR